MSFGTVSSGRVGASFVLVYFEYFDKIFVCNDQADIFFF